MSSRFHVMKVITVVYQGFVPSVTAENIMGKSYAKCTKEVIQDKERKGFDLAAEKKYVSMYGKKYSEKRNRRFCTHSNIYH
jgi:hypothetical protein